MLDAFMMPHIVVYDTGKGKPVLEYETRDDALEECVHMGLEGHRIIGFYPFPLSIH